MSTSREISRILAYLNDETIHVKSSSDVASIVNIINRVAMNNHPSDSLLHSDLYSIANKLLSPRAALAMQEAQKINGSLVQYGCLLWSRLSFPKREQRSIFLIVDYCLCSKRTRSTSSSTNWRNRTFKRISPCPLSISPTIALNPLSDLHTVCTIGLPPLERATSLGRGLVRVHHELAGLPR